MTTSDTRTGNSQAFGNSTGGWNMALRRIASILLAINLYSIDYPFTPVSWFTRLEAGRLLDQLFGTALLMGASIFQWHIAGIRYSLPLNCSLDGASKTPVYVRGTRRDADNEAVIIWKPQYYWILAVVESFLLGVAWASSHIFITRCVVVAIVSASWFIGLPATPTSFRREVWARLKNIWERIIATEFYGNVNRRGRYR